MRLVQAIKKMARQVCLATFLMTFSPSLFGMDACSSVFDTSPEVNEHLQTARYPLRIPDVPGLRAQASMFLQDSRIPKALKKILTETASRPDVGIFELTEKGLNQAKFNFDFEQLSSADGLYVPHEGKVGFSTKRNVFATHTNTQFKHVVMVRNKGNQSLSSLIHELGHVRFHEYFVRNLEWISQQFPGFVLKNDSGEYEVDFTLYSFLAERYANELQIRLHLASNGEYTSPWIDAVKGGVTRDNARSILDKRLSDSYARLGGMVEIIEYFKQHSLFSILRKGADEFLSERADRTEAMMLRILQFAERSRDQQTKPANDPGPARNPFVSRD